MTVEEFQERKAALVATYGSTGAEAGRKRAQALARLYAESGFTVRDLGDLEHLSHARITQLLIFGRFLQFLVTLGYQEYPSNEKTFRTAWRSTDTSRVESARFQAIAAQLETQQVSVITQPDRQAHKRLAMQLLEKYGDGKWHRLPTMASAVEADVATVQRILDAMVHQGAYKTFAEKRDAGKDRFAYRLVKGGKKKIDLTAFHNEVGDAIAEMKDLVFGHHVHFSQTVMRVTFDKFLKAIERLAR